jgi:hypothetical protein
MSKCVEQVGFANVVAANEHIESRLKLDPQVFEIAKVLDGYGG